MLQTYTHNGRTALTSPLSIFATTATPLLRLLLWPQLRQLQLTAATTTTTAKAASASTTITTLAIHTSQGAQHVEQHIEQMHFNKPTSAAKAAAAARDGAVIGKNRQPQTTQRQQQQHRSQNQNVRVWQVLTLRNRYSRS